MLVCGLAGRAPSQQEVYPLLARRQREGFYSRRILGTCFGFSCMCAFWHFHVFGKSSLPVATWSRRGGKSPFWPTEKELTEYDQSQRGGIWTLQGSKGKCTSSQFAERQFALKQQFLKLCAICCFENLFPSNVYFTVFLHTLFHVQYDREKIWKI